MESRCRRDVAPWARLPKATVAKRVRTIFAQPGADQVHARFSRVVEQLSDAAAACLVDAACDLLAFGSSQPSTAARAWSNKLHER